MKNVNILPSLLVVIFITYGCNSKTEKFQKHRNKIINVEDRIIEIDTDIIFGFSLIYLIDDFLIVSELKPGGNRGIHIFDKNTFKYIKSTAIIGRGPGEVGRTGNVGIDNNSMILWVHDYAKNLLWKFPLDSILNTDLYKPTDSHHINYDLFMERYGFINDSIVIGKAVSILPDHSFIQIMAKLNLNTNKIEPFGYEHSKAVGKKSYSSFSLSLKNNLYVNCYSNSDLMTISDLDGNLKYNVYGPGWLKNKDNKNNYFIGVDLLNNNIIASYLGDVGIYVDEYERLQGNSPTKFLVFDLEGNYKETIETGSGIQFFCVDEENDRIIVYFEDRENPLGYFNLNFDEL